MSGGASGSGRRGGPSAKDSGADEIGGSWEYFRSGGAVYLWGKNERGADTYTGLSMGAAGASGVGADVLRAVPMIFPRGGTITRMGFMPTNVNGGPGSVRIGIYSNGTIAVGGGHFYPAELLSDSGSFSSWADTGAFPELAWQTWAPNLSVAPMTILWAAWNYNDQMRIDSRGLSAINGDNCSGLLGYWAPDEVRPGDFQARGPSAAARIYGWRAPQSFGTMPPSFPTANAQPLQDGNTIGESGVWTNKVLVMPFKWSDSG